jgi:hypothetical protein
MPVRNDQHLGATERKNRSAESPDAFDELDADDITGVVPPCASRPRLPEG